MIPRLISVMEILKREHLKTLDVPAGQLMDCISTMNCNGNNVAKSLQKGRSVIRILEGKKQRVFRVWKSVLGLTLFHTTKVQPRTQLNADFSVGVGVRDAELVVGQTLSAFMMVKAMLAGGKNKAQTDISQDARSTGMVIGSPRSTSRPRIAKSCNVPFANLGMHLEDATYVRWFRSDHIKAMMTRDKRFEGGTLSDEPCTATWIQNKVFQLKYCNENVKQDSGAVLEWVSR
ncbi:uncharacterized protein BJ212DRAFT_1585982 [Suillus subaureus]|uniref:Uncharacterized protein n=1 Tax=Suillus subaureus TaxID=48587 RepID=A0A9P7EGF5_9AGAM|nr:uncharacterized protein BJ212DRAFT_1585982 [Suillus subaureus]KAG1820953.1 hypothetical protein BJ212DRAFT_1585982 [Suillus subaureus]